MRMNLAILAVAVIALSGCASSPGAQVGSPNADDLDDSWQLDSGTDSSGSFDLGDLTVTLEIDDARASGKAPCNSYTGGFSSTADGVTFGPLASTRMACSPDSVMKLETRYLAALEAVDTAVIDPAAPGDTLTLSRGNSVTLVFTETDEPENDGPESVDLVGPIWSLETITTGDASSTVQGEATLVFGEDGSLHGSAGCRGFTGNYVHNGDEDDAAGAEITLTHLEIDNSDCPADIGDQETVVFDLIGKGFTAAVVGDILTITRTGSDSALVYRAGEAQ